MYLLRRFWDDWMRLPEQRKDRTCIRPEISRTAMSIEGKKGVSLYVYLSKKRPIFLQSICFSEVNITNDF